VKLQEKSLNKKKLSEEQYRKLRDNRKLKKLRNDRQRLLNDISSDYKLKKIRRLL
jgi:hypothetical protein